MWKRRRKKIDYSKKRYSNPFFRRKRAKIYNLYPQFSWRSKLIFSLILAIISGITYFLFFSSYFYIKTIEVRGGEKISIQTIEDLAWQRTGKRRFLIGSQKNINLFDKKNLIESLGEEYALESVGVNKNRPAQLVIEVKERAPSLVWYEGEKYYFIDSSGYIISEVEPIQINQKDYPLIENKGQRRISGRKIEITNDYLIYITKLFNEFKNNYKDFLVDRFILDVDLNTVKLALFNGPKIYFNPAISINEQIDKLIILINQKLKENFKNKNHIDLRFGDKVYYE